jgi:hypothetical protein
VARWPRNCTPAHGNRVILVGRSHRQRTVGRGTGKISATQLADVFWAHSLADHDAMPISEQKMLGHLRRLAPALTGRKMRMPGEASAVVAARGRSRREPDGQNALGVNPAMSMA